MPVTHFETRVICDNCGSVVSRNMMDAEDSIQEAAIVDAALPEMDPCEEVLLNEGDVLGEESAEPLEVLIEHVSSCKRCS